MNVDRRLLKDRSWAVKYPRAFSITGAIIGVGIIFSGPLYFIFGNKLETLDIPDPEFSKYFK